MAPQPEGEVVDAAEKKQAAAAEALRVSLTEFAARAGHDMVGPLNQAASLMALLIRRQRAQMGADADNLLEYLQSSSIRMEGVVSGVRAYMDAAHAPRFTDVDLNQSLAAALELLRQPIEESGANIESGSLPRICADPVQMVTLFEILIGNAVKFRHVDRPAYIRVSGSCADDVAHVAIEDNGIGIPPEFSEAVFQPFRRLNGTAYRGPGLGLTIARLITRMHGGTIRVEPVTMPPGTSLNLLLSVL